MDRQTHGVGKKETGRQIEEGMKGGMDGGRDRRREGWTEGRTEGWIDAEMKGMMGRGCG
jgi:hypothetical protein